MTRIYLCWAALLLGGCATAPPLTSASPASSDAPEGARTLRYTSLRADEMSRKTTTLLSAAQKEQEQWDEYGPVSGSPGEMPKADTQPKTKHEHH